MREVRARSKQQKETEGGLTLKEEDDFRFLQQYRRSLIFDNRIFDGHYLLQVMQPCVGSQIRHDGKAQEKNISKFVFELDFMVKLLRACVWMPWRKQAMKDVVSCDKLRGGANSLRSGDF